jgi:hypothetical protein
MIDYSPNFYSEKELFKFFGCWVANTKVFYNRRDALLYASKNGCPKIRWHWHDKVWDAYDRNLLGKVSLDELYRQRAQQLRDKYDYLILSYSGGSDSHNALMAFINNNIKLDQIFVHIPAKIMNSSAHIPNTSDKSARNLMSEWDYVIEPTLKKLAQTHPNIKIEISDWTDNLSEDVFKKESTSMVTDVWGMGNLGRNISFSKLGREQLDKGKSVATICGADKPCIGLDHTSNDVYMFFVDRPVLLSAAGSTGANETFYWSPDLPDVAFEMAYQTFLYYKANPHLQNMMWSTNQVLDTYTLLTLTSNISRLVCYSSTWDFNKFQANKSYGICTDKDFFLYEFSEFQHIRDSWKYHYAGFFEGIDSSYLDVDNQMNKIRSKAHYLGKL